MIVSKQLVGTSIFNSCIHLTNLCQWKFMFYDIFILTWPVANLYVSMIINMLSSIIFLLYQFLSLDHRQHNQYL
ncbi:unnamed protein product [Rotaria magnacalcarata]